MHKKIEQPIWAGMRLVLHFASDRYLNKSQILAGEIKKINGKYVGAVAYTTGIEENISLIPLPSSPSNSYKFSQKKFKNPSLVERASAKLRGTEEYSFLGQPETSMSYE